jgi:hypothetical protein
MIFVSELHKPHFLPILEFSGFTSNCNFHLNTEYVCEIECSKNQDGVILKYIT